MIIRKSWSTPDNNNNNRGDGKEGGEEGKGEREERRRRRRRKIVADKKVDIEGSIRGPRGPKNHAESRKTNLQHIL